MRSKADAGNLSPADNRVTTKCRVIMSRFSRSTRPGELLVGFTIKDMRWNELVRFEMNAEEFATLLTAMHAELDVSFEDKVREVMLDE